ncbi:DUF2892 domain-containing protein [Thiohalocapsa marina]|uniref:DUF2892 domain-containing protein n=1 Tax=Thiohalocapsa marina TaxID=424902 RepID=A0A5M8FRR2_9GAMM|nr:DUF2892 domain-containing protein [Thiohalocapsa marina]KAA6185675.1 DUF2892 domain-containing protein [Thiohalocapsa marina]
MTKNIGKQDRNIRYGVGAVMIVVGLLTQTWWLALIGLVPVGTAYMGSCPAYSALNIDTRKGGE